MVPFVNRKYNILCNNPLEEDIEAVRASTIGMKEFLSLLGMDSSNAKRYRDFYKNISIPLDGNDHKFCTIVPRNDETELIIINPRLMFAGDDWQYVESLSHSVGSILFVIKSKMAIDVHRCPDFFVPQPFLHSFEVVPFGY